MANDASSFDAARLRRLEQLFDALHFPVFFKDPQGRYIDMNEAFVDAFGERSPVTRDQILGTTDYDHMPHSDAELYEHKDRAVLDGHRIVRHEEPLIHDDGEVQFFSTTKVATTDPDGEVDGLLAFSIELSGSSSVDAAIAESERRHRLALRASRDGIWELDVRTGKMRLNARACRMLQRHVGDDVLDLGEIHRLVGHAQVTEFMDRLGRVASDHTRTLEIEVEVDLPDGSIGVFELVGAALNDDGVTSHVIGSIGDITEARANERQLSHLADHDDLTGLSNRRALLRALSEASDDGRTHTLLFCDLNDFKVVNDSLGHAAGDELLVWVARLLKRMAGPDDVVARLGGDEFAVLTHGDLEAARELSTRVDRALHGRFRLGDAEVYTSVSIGLVPLDGAASPDELLRDADTAMYEAKRQKAGVRVFEPLMRAHAVSEQQLQTEVRGALEQGRFLLHYQPLVSADDRSIVAAEALLRWRRDDETIDAPGAILPFLERSGLIVEVGAFVIDEACRQLAEWRREGLFGHTIGVNLSRVQLLRSDLVDTIQTALRAHGVTADGFVFEVTETSLSGEDELIVDTLAELRHLGARIAIDDFGVGRSALVTLDRLPIDVVKIDKSFVDRVGTGDATVLRAMLWLARELGLRTVAEGVETAEQVAYLTAHGCDSLQGFHFDRPVAARTISERLRHGHPEGSYGPTRAATSVVGREHPGAVFD